MGWFSAPGYWLSRLVFERALGAIYLVAFLVAVNQLRPLVGEHGLLPAPRFLRMVSFRQSPSLLYHHETQPMPNPLSWWFHHLPASLHKMEVLANHVAQLVVPFGLFAPQPVASVAGALIIVTQGWLVLSGNFSWLNAVTITLATASLDDARLGKVLRIAHPHLHASPPWREALVIAV